jgi:hypothetical protein
MTDRIPSRLQELLARELAPGERVAWRGRPSPIGRALSAWGTFLFGIPFFAFSVFWTYAATNGFNEPRRADIVAFSKLAWLWGGAFVLVGASLLLSPAWEWWAARRTLYAITDRRAILIEAPLWRTTTQSFAGERLGSVVRRESRSGRGDLIFEREATKGAKGSTVYRDVGFFGIDGVHEVQGLLPTTSSLTQHDR